MKHYTRLYWEEDNNIGHLVINDPPANKMTKIWFDEFNQVFRKDIYKSAVRGILIYGKGRHFSSGADIEQLRKNVATRILISQENDIDAYPKYLSDFRESCAYLDELSIPVIGAVNGICFGSGLELALSCHMRVCGSGALLSSPEVTYEFPPGVGGTQRLPALVGYGKAVEMIVGGEPIGAKEALSSGLVDVITDKRETVKSAETLIRYIIDIKAPYTKANRGSYIKQFNQYIHNAKDLKSDRVIS